jgi:hypothetical protein
MCAHISDLCLDAILVQFWDPDIDFYNPWIQTLNIGWGLIEEICEFLVIGGRFGIYQPNKVIYTL